MKIKSVRARLPAKFVGPDVGQAVFRKRLFELIEAHKAARLWVHGPPGSGKTTLVASYLQAYKLRPIWYQFDAGDREPSTFFHFLATAIRSSVPARYKLPIAEAETRDDWIGFARRFFRAMLVGLADNDVLVFENVHEANGALNEVLALLVAEAASGQQIIFTSHHAPPAAFVDAIAKRQLAELNADALRFDLIEASALIDSITGSRAEEEDVNSLQTLTEGWAAGLVLLSSQPLGELKLDGVKPASRSRLFEYFSRVVIEKMPAETRAVVEACAFLPDFNAEMAIAASGNPQAAVILESLHRNGLFIEVRLVGGSRVFQFHALLVEALRDRTGAAGSTKRRHAMAHAGRLLAASGRLDASFPLLVESGEANSAAALLLQVAEASIAEGRIEHFAGLIETLPTDVRASHRWLDYWLGLGLAATDEAVARRLLASVYERFKSSNDRLGCLLCAAAMVTSIQSGWQSFEGYEQWGHALHSHWAEDFSFPTPESELRAFVAFVWLLSSGIGAKSSVQELADLSDRAIGLIKRVRDVNAQLSAAATMVNWFMDIGEHHRAVFFENFIEREVQAEQANPSQRATWYWILSMMNTITANVLHKPELVERARKHRLAAERIAKNHELTAVKISLVHAEADRCIWARDPVGAGAALDSVEIEIQPGRARQMVWHLSRRTQVALLCGKPEQALAAISHALQLAEEAQFPASESSGYRGVASNALLYLRRYDEALAYLERASEKTSGRHRLLFEVAMLFVPALRVADGSDWNPSPVADFFAVIREKRLLSWGRFMDPLVARTCAAALAHDIESEFVRELVLHRKFLPPANAPVNWPWPLKIEALGGFKVSIGGTPLVFDGKGQKKPLEMLQLIVALQDSITGVGPKMQQVMDELWPSLEAKDPQGSFDTNLHRLRKLIDVEGAIVLADVHLSLNRALVWCDVAAFEMLVRTNLPDDDLRASKQYAGPLLDSTVYSWSAAPRERLAAVYTGLVERCATRLEDNGDYTAAIGLYERALQQDNLIESFYRGLMRCHHARGENTEALRMYRRCRELLSIVLNTIPAPETEVLRAKLAV